MDQHLAFVPVQAFLAPPELLVLPTATLTIPNDLPFGPYTVSLRLDGQNAVPESDEDNNNMDLPGTLTVVTP